MKETRMPGLWTSPISPKSLAESLRLSDPCWDTDGQTLAWLEGRSDRGVLVVQAADGSAPRDLTGERSVRAMVGYGGGDFTLSRGVAYFVGQADQRIYRQDLAGGDARPITPAFGVAASPCVSPDGRWLAYVHSVDGVDSLALVDTGGRNWPVRLALGRDFYMQPAWHPDGGELAWIEWDHPNMPWDGTELRLARLECPADPTAGLPRLIDARTVAGGPDTAILQPGFTADGRALLYISDESGWGHLRRQELAGGAARGLTAGECEHGAPAWIQGVSRYTVLPSGRIVVVRSRGGFDRLVVLDPLGGPETELLTDPLYARFMAPRAASEAEALALVASGPTQPPRVVVLGLEASGGVRGSVRRRATGETVPPGDLAGAEPVSWSSFDGATAHGLFLAPTSRRFESTAPPPLIVMVHGGPTAQATAEWNPAAQFYATRGYAVLMVNYRGSTGAGREYMLKLRHSWGIYDVEDSRTGAAWLAGQGRVDGQRLVIAGGSAGGYTVLQSLINHPGFYKAGLCYFGVSNQFLLAADTHKFEARYSDRLLGPLPEAAPLYRERSPIFHADRISDPIAVFQGEKDQVVPQRQSDDIVASLKARGIPHEYHLYPGEGHGWRKAETIEAFYQAIDRFLRQHVLYA